MIPKNRSIDVLCRANTGPINRTPVLFEPIHNTELPSGLSLQEELKSVKQGNCSLMNVKITNQTNHDIILHGRTVIGHLQLVRSVTLIEVKLKEPKSSPNQHVEENKREESDAVVVENLPPVDLTGLNSEQLRQATQLLYDERESFAQDDDDVGCIPELTRDLTLTSGKPVQKNYASITRPLYPEVKGYIEDLLNRGFIKKSKSPYSSSVVCVGKKTVECGCVWIIGSSTEIPCPTDIQYLGYKTRSTVSGGNRGSVFLTKAKHTIRVPWERKVNI